MPCRVLARSCLFHCFSSLLVLAALGADAAGCGACIWVLCVGIVGSDSVRSAGVSGSVCVWDRLRGGGLISLAVCSASLAER